MKPLYPSNAGGSICLSSAVSAGAGPAAGHPADAGGGPGPGSGTEEGEPRPHRGPDPADPAGPRRAGRRPTGRCSGTSRTPASPAPASAARRACSAGSRPPAATSCGPGTPSTDRRSAAARGTCSLSSTTTAGRSWATGSGSPRTPSAWPPPCGRPCLPAGSRTRSTSTTGRRSWTRGCFVRARLWPSASLTPSPDGLRVAEGSNGSSAPSVTSSWSSSTRNVSVRLSISPS